MKTCPKTNEKARNHEKPAKTQYFIVENLGEFIATKSDKISFKDKVQEINNKTLRIYMETVEIIKNEIIDRYILRRNLHKQHCEKGV